MKAEIVEELARAITMVLCEQHEDCKSLPDAIRIGAVPIINRLVSEARKEGRREIANAYVSAMRTAKGSGHA